MNIFLSWYELLTTAIAIEKKHKVLFALHNYTSGGNSTKLFIIIRTNTAQILYTYELIAEVFELMVSLGSFPVTLNSNLRAIF